MLAESHTAALGVKMSPNIHEVSLASAHAPFFATVMRQPAGTAASADTDASADPQVKQNQQRNIDTQTDPFHILSPFLRSWSYGGDTWQAVSLSWWQKSHPHSPPPVFHPIIEYPPGNVYCFLLLDLTIGRF
jgi:hypothetical protein